MHQPYDQGCFISLVVNWVYHEHFSQVSGAWVTLLRQLVGLQDHNVLAGPLCELKLLIVEVEQRVCNVRSLSILPSQHIYSVKDQLKSGIVSFSQLEAKASQRILGQSVPDGHGPEIRTQCDELIVSRLSDLIHS